VSRQPTRRGPLALIAALVVAGTVAASLLGSSGPPPAALDAVASSPARAQTTAWYCAGATTVAGGAADGTIVVADAGASPLHGTLTVVSNQGASAAMSLGIGPFSSVAIHEADLLKAPFVAATVVLQGGHGAVEQQVSGPLGAASTPCASTTSPRWYFGAGSTVDGASLLIALYDPFPSDAIADLSFATDQGQTAPAEFQGIYVPARSVTMVDIGAHVVDRPVVAMTVSARSGALVAAKLQLDTVAGQKGLTLVTGAPTTAAVWRFPDGGLTPGVTDTYYLYNPNTAPAPVRVGVALTTGRAEPFRIEVGAQSVVALPANGETRIPKGDGYTVTARSSGPPIVVERVVDYPGGARTGLGDLLGSPAAARHWVLAAGAADSTHDEWLVVANPQTDPVRLSVARLVGSTPTPVPGLDAVVVAPGARSALRLGDHLQGAFLPLIVTASAPVVVERDLYRSGGGVSAAIGVALGALSPLS